MLVFTEFELSNIVWLILRFVVRNFIAREESFMAVDRGSKKRSSGVRTTSCRMILMNEHRPS